MLVRSCPLLPITVLSSQHCPPPPHHSPYLPITVPSCLFLLSRPSHHCPPPPYHCPLLPITVSSLPPLSPPPHHCPLLPITSCYHGRLFIPQSIPSSPYSGQLLLCVSDQVVCQQFRSRLSGDLLVWARDWTHLDEQCGMYCQPPSRLKTQMESFVWSFSAY